MFVLVVAKEPVPGRVKTRLCPPCTPEQAASIAEAALRDTFAAARRCRATEIVVALDGAPGPWLPDGVRVVDQGSGAFDERLTRAWSHTSGPGVQIGMDTPQVTASMLDAALDAVADGTAVLGPADDGGWWLLGLPVADDRIFRGIPMSTSTTGAAQRRRLEDLGYRIREAPPLRDVDHADDAVAVAAVAPDSHFARAVAVAGLGRSRAGRDRHGAGGARAMTDIAS